MQSIPANLDANTQHDECGEAYHHASSSRSQPLYDVFGVAIAKVERTKTGIKVDKKVSAGCPQTKIPINKDLGF